MLFPHVEHVTLSHRFKILMKIPYESTKIFNLWYNVCAYKACVV